MLSNGRDVEKGAPLDMSLAMLSPNAEKNKQDMSFQTGHAEVYANGEGPDLRSQSARAEGVMTLGVHAERERVKAAS